MRFDYDGGGLGKGGAITLTVDGEPVATGRVDGTQPFMFSMDETLDIGSETGTAVSSDYTPRTSAFTGTIHEVRLDAGNDSHDHLIGSGAPGAHRGHAAVVAVHRRLVRNGRVGRRGGRQFVLNSNGPGVRRRRSLGIRARSGEVSGS